MAVSHLFVRPDYGKSASEGLGRKGALALITRVAPGLATFVANILIGRIGGSVLLGATQTVMSAASLGALVYPAGSAASRYVASLGAQGRSEEARAVSRHLARRVMLVSLVLALLGSVAAVLVWGIAPGVGVMIGIMLLAVSGRAFVEGLHFGGGEGARLAQWSLLVAVLSTVSVAGLLIAGVREVWVLAPLAGLNLLFIALSWPREGRGRVDAPLRREIRTFLLLSVLGSLTSTGFAQAAILVAGVTQTLAFVGQYAAAMTLTTPLGLAASALSAVLFPALAAAHGTNAGGLVPDRLRTSTSLMVTIMVGVYIPVILLSQQIIEIIWGSGFPEAAWIILFLLPAAVASTVAVPAVSAVTAASNRGMAMSAASSACGAAVGVVLWMVLSAVDAEYAVPLGFAVGTFLIAAIPYVIAWRQNRMRWSGETALTLGGIIVPLVAAVVVREFLGGGALASILLALLLLLLWVVARRRSIRWIVAYVRPALRGRR